MALQFQKCEFPARPYLISDNAQRMEALCGAIPFTRDQCCFGVDAIRTQIFAAQTNAFSTLHRRKYDEIASWTATPSVRSTHRRILHSGRAHIGGSRKIINRDDSASAQATCTDKSRKPSSLTKNYVNA